MKQESPLNQIDLSSLAETSALQVKEVALLDYLILRADSGNRSLQKAITSVLGTKLPLEPNTTTGTGDNHVLWYGPNEWLIITPSGQGAKLVNAFHVAFDGMHAAVTEVTGANSLLEVSGPAARDLLAKATPLDLHISVFKPGRCAQTVFAKTAATIYLLDDGETFRLIFRRSFADYVGAWMLNAAKEFLHAKVAS